MIYYPVHPFLVKIHKMTIIFMQCCSLTVTSMNLIFLLHCNQVTGSPLNYSYWTLRIECELFYSISHSLEIETFVWCWIFTCD